MLYSPMFSVAWHRLLDVKNREGTLRFWRRISSQLDESQTRDGGVSWEWGKKEGQNSLPSICDREAAKMRVKYWRNVTGVFQTPPPPPPAPLSIIKIFSAQAPTKTSSLPSWEKVERGGPDCLLFRRGGCRERISADIIAAGSDPPLPSPPQKKYK